MGINHPLDPETSDNLARENDCCKTTLEVLYGNTIAQALFREKELTSS